MDIGLFGGSFNPPHIAHLIVAEIVRDQFALEEVWWIPNATPPHKPEEALVSSEHRMTMTRRAVDSNSQFRVCDVEVAREGVSYTVDTLRVLQEEHPDTAFGLIIGSDSLDHFAEWHEPDEIVRRVPLIVYKRPGSLEAVAERRFANQVHYVAAPVLEVSGTEIRARCRKGRSIQYLVPEGVRSYIQEEGLYQHGPSS